MEVYAAAGDFNAVWRSELQDQYSSDGDAATKFAGKPYDDKMWEVLSRDSKMLADCVGGPLSVYDVYISRVAEYAQLSDSVFAKSGQKYTYAANLQVFNALEKCGLHHLAPQVGTVGFSLNAWAPIRSTPTLSLTIL